MFVRQAQFRVWFTKVMHIRREEKSPPSRKKYERQRAFFPDDLKILIPSLSPNPPPLCKKVSLKRLNPPEKLLFKKLTLPSGNRKLIKCAHAFVPHFRHKSWVTIIINYSLKSGKRPAEREEGGGKGKSFRRKKIFWINFHMKGLEERNGILLAMQDIMFDMTWPKSPLWLMPEVCDVGNTFLEYQVDEISRNLWIEESERRKICFQAGKGWKENGKCFEKVL